MAISTQDSGAAFIEYIADGTIAAFTVPFPSMDRTHIQVLDNETLKTIVTDYKLTAEDPLGPGGVYGTITFGVAPTNGHVVRIQRHTPLALFKGTLEIGHLQAIQAFFRMQEFTDFGSALPFNFIAADLATPSPQYVVAPYDCFIAKADATVTVAISTGGDITFKNGAGGSTVAGLTVTLANAAAAGTKVSDFPTKDDATTFVHRGALIEVDAGSAFNGGGSVVGNVWVRRALAK